MELFDEHFPRLFRYLDRLSGDADLASDLAQEAFVRLYRRGSLPASPEAWLVAVSMNLFRNARTTRARRRRLLTPERGRESHSDPPPSPEVRALADSARVRARAALDAISERDRTMLLLQAEGYSYKEIATALGLSQGSVGTLLARARRAFQEAYEGRADAP